MISISSLDFGPVPKPIRRPIGLRLPKKCVANARYADVQLKQGKSGSLLLVVIETTFSTEQGERLLVNRQTLIWR